MTLSRVPVPVKAVGKERIERKALHFASRVHDVQIYSSTQGVFSISCFRNAAQHAAP